MLSKKTFKECIEMLITFYPTWGIKVEDSKVMTMWYGAFQNFEDNQFLTSVKKHIETEKYNPTVASLLEKINTQSTIYKGFNDYYEED